MHIASAKKYRYSGIDGEYRNDWLYFESSQEDFEEEYGLIMNHPILLAVVLNKLMQENQVIAETGAYNPYASKLQELRLTMQSRPAKNFSSEENERIQ